MPPFPEYIIPKSISNPQPDRLASRVPGSASYPRQFLVKVCDLAYQVHLVGIKNTLDNEKAIFLKLSYLMFREREMCHTIPPMRGRGRDSVSDTNGTSLSKKSKLRRR